MKGSQDVGPICETLNCNPGLASAAGCVEIMDQCLVENLGHIVEHVCQNHILFDKCLGNSYRHANGFDKIVLLSGSNFKLRLHRFVPDDKQVPPAEHVHNHRWPFASHILQGKLNMDLFEETENTSACLFHKYIYNSDKIDGGFSAEYMGINNVSCVARDVQYESGTTYSMEPEELHRIRQDVALAPTTTLMLTGKPISTTCKLFSNTRLTFEETRTQPYSREELLEILNYWISKA